MINGYSAFTTHANGIMMKLTSDIQIHSVNNSCGALALWDTGATGTCISEELARNLALIPTGMCAIKTPSGTLDVPTYLVDIQLPNNVLIKDVVVMESKIGEQGLDTLIGMDIISKGDFAVSNHESKTQFSFVIPSMQPINFIPKVKTLNKVNQGHMKKKK